MEQPDNMDQRIAKFAVYHDLLVSSFVSHLSEIEDGLPADTTVHQMEFKEDHVLVTVKSQEFHVSDGHVPALEMYIRRDENGFYKMIKKEVR